MKGAGYHTGHIGVWHLGIPPYTEDNRYGIDHLAAVKGVGGNYYDQYYYLNDAEPIQHMGWSPTAETNMAIDFMREHKDKQPNDPFALFVSWRPPHWMGRWRGVRTENYTYARWFDNERGPWLFDHQEDPLEMRNIIDSAEARPAVEEMEARLHLWMEATQDPFESGKRGPRGFLEIGQKWADPEQYARWGLS